MDTDDKKQSHSSPTPSNSYQGSSTPVATSNRQSLPLFGRNLSPLSQNSQFQDVTSFQSAGHPPNAHQEVTMRQTSLIPI